MWGLQMRHPLSPIVLLCNTPFKTIRSLCFMLYDVLPPPLPVESITFSRSKRVSVKRDTLKYFCAQNGEFIALARERG